MNTQTMSRFSLLNIMTGLAVLFLILFLGLNQIVHAAGTSSKPSTKSMTAAEKRAHANEYFEEAKDLQERGNYKNASKQYKRAIKADPTYAEAYSNLGYTYRKQEKFKKAVRAYKKAIKLNPDLVEAHEYLGETYAEMGKFDLAEKELQTLRALGSDEAGELKEFIHKMKAKN